MMISNSGRLVGSTVLIAGAAAVFFSVSPVASQAPEQGSAANIASRNQQFGLTGSISGRVTWDDGKPADGCLVKAYFVRHASGMAGEGNATTDAQGNYQIRGLAPTAFRVVVANDGEPYIPDPERVVDLKTSGKESAGGIDFTIHKGPEITVHARDAQTGAALVGIPVKAKQSPYGSLEQIGVTDSSGDLRFRSGQLKTTVTLERLLGKGRELQDAPGSDPFQIVEFADTHAVHDVVLTFKKYSSDNASNNVVFHGTVTDSAGKPVAGAVVRMSRQGTSIPYQAITDTSGAFSFSTYRMQPVEYSDGKYGQTAVHGIVIRVEKDGLTVIHYATPEETWTSIPVQLTNENHASIVGQVVDPKGRPAAGVHVSCLEQFAKAQGIFQKNCGVTDAEGHFKVDGLSADGYYWFTFGGHHLYNAPAPDYGFTHVPDRKETVWGVSLRDGEKHNLGKITVWPADTQIAGLLVGSGASRAQTGDLLIVIGGAHTSVSVHPKPDGTFTTDPLVREPLTLAVYVSPGNHGFSYDFDTPGSKYEVARQAVAAGDTAVSVSVR